MAKLVVDVSDALGLQERLDMLAKVVAEATARVGVCDSYSAGFRDGLAEALRVLAGKGSE